MAEIPGGGVVSDLNVTRYRVTRCCNASETALFIISDTFTPELLPNETLVYRWLGGSPVTTVGGVTFEPGYCYTIENLGQGAPVQNVISWTDFESTDPDEGCQDAKCAPCEDPDPMIPMKLVWTPCCDAFDVVETKGDNYQDYLGVIAPIQATQVAWPQGILINQCYHVTVEQTTIEIYNSLPNPVPYIYNGPNAQGNTYIPVVADTSIVEPCSDPVALTVCPECPVDCYRVVNCDGSQDFNVVSSPDIYGAQDISNFVNQFVTLVDADGAMEGTFYVFETLEPCTNAISFISVDPVLPEPCDCLCTEIVFDHTAPTINPIPTPIPKPGSKNEKAIFAPSIPPTSPVPSKGILYVDCDGNPQYLFGDGIICTRIYPTINNPEWYTGLLDNATITQSGPCIDGECPPECYALVNCTTNEVIFSTQEILYTYYGLNQIVTIDGYEGCWQVLDGSCQCIDITIDGGAAIKAYATSYYNGQFVWEFVLDSVTYYIWADSVAPGGWLITQQIGVSSLSNTLGTIESGVLNCPVADETVWIAGRLPNGESAESILTTSCEEQCSSCATNVTVLTTFTSCTDCIGVIAYRLQNCDNPADIIYTTTDLSQHVDRTVEIDCGCYLVELITYNPPTDTAVTVLYSFENCIKCKTKYYQLVDCADETNIIYTDVSLAEYVNKIIKIANCDNCWTVSETRNPGTVETVIFESAYATCPECLVADLKCECVNITNVTEDVTGQVEYYDCDDVFFSYKLSPGETTGKMCVKYIVPSSAYSNGIFYLEKFGDCQQGVCPQPTFKNNRTVKPGYNTPICSAEKYDKITCNFADAMYKDALEKRYGISNCCPEDDQKWIVKKLLIDMQALKDLDFPSSTSTCKTGNCGS